MAVLFAGCCAQLDPLTLADAALERMASDSMVSVSGLHRAVIQGLTRQSRATAPSLALDPRVKPEGDERRGRNTDAPPPKPVFAGLDPAIQGDRSVACPGPDRKSTRLNSSH